MGRRKPCSVCSASVYAGSLTGICGRNPACRAARKEALARYRACNPKMPVRRPAEAAAMLAAAHSERELIEARRRARGVPAEGRPPWWLDDLFARPV